MNILKIFSTTNKINKDGGVTVDLWIILTFEINFRSSLYSYVKWIIFEITFGSVGKVTYTSTNSLPMNPSFPQDDINKKFTLVRK